MFSRFCLLGLTNGTWSKIIRINNCMVLLHQKKVCNFNQSWKISSWWWHLKPFPNHLTFNSTFSNLDLVQLIRFPCIKSYLQDYIGIEWFNTDKCILKQFLTESFQFTILLNQKWWCREQELIEVDSTCRTREITNKL